MENKKARILNVIGILMIVLGIIGSLIMGDTFPSITYDYSYYSGYHIEETYNWELAIIGSVVCFITGMCFIGFGEIINMLQKITNQQITMLHIIATKQDTIINSINNQKNN